QQRLVSPLLDRGNRRRVKHAVRTKDTCVPDDTGVIDRRLENHHPFDLSAHGNCRILRLDAVSESRRGDVTTDADRSDRCRRRWWRRTLEAAEDAARNPA